MTEPLLNPQWLNFAAGYQRIFIGFSGGLDSTVLLHILSTQHLLQDKLCAVHVHHGLSLNADAWQRHCEEVCIALKIPIITNRIKLELPANIEEQARDARYQLFQELLTEEDCILLAHHADDQAETVLLQLFRGAGVDGLAAMPAMKALGKGRVLRPFLHLSRRMLEAYANDHQLQWIEDESNKNSAYSRNFLRQQVIPLLHQKWPNVISNLARSAGHFQDAKANLSTLAVYDCADIQEDKLFLPPLQKLSDRRLGNVVRAWLKNKGVKLPPTATFKRLFQEVIKAKEDALPVVEWDEVAVRRYQQYLYLLRKPAASEYTDCQDSLLGELIKEGLQIPDGSKVTIRYRVGGETLRWHGQTKDLKKLFQEWQIPPWQRDQIPLVFIDEILAAVKGYAISDDFS